MMTTPGLTGALVTWPLTGARASYIVSGAAATCTAASGTAASGGSPSAPWWPGGDSGVWSPTGTWSSATSPPSMWTRSSGSSRGRVRMVRAPSCVGVRGRRTGRAHPWRARAAPPAHRWQQYWPLIGRYWSCDLDTDLWLVDRWPPAGSSPTPRSWGRWSPSW